MKRNAYILTCDKKSERAQQSKNLLSSIGFQVTLCDIISYPICVATSNLMSMRRIYQTISKSDDEWAYVFEDDFSLVEPITLKEIVQYESISSHLFYLGCCMENISKSNATQNSINGHTVYNVKKTACLHALALRKSSVNLLYSYMEKHSNLKFLDQIIGDKFVGDYGANVVRYDLISPQESGHRGVIYQDRIKFPSLWKEDNWGIKSKNI